MSFSNGSSNGSCVFGSSIIGSQLLRNSIQSASNFGCRNHLPPRLKEQILAYMCLRFKAESLNQQQLIEQLPKTICKSIRHHLFLPTVEKVYLFKGVSREILLRLVADMKAEYIPPREDVIMQNESPDEVYIIVSREVEMIDSEMENEKIVWTLRSEDMFGEVGAFCCRPQSYTYRTRTLSQLLKIRTSSLIDGMKSRQEDNVTMMTNFIQLRSTVFDISDGSSEGIVFYSAAGLVAVHSENYYIQFYSLFDDHEVSEEYIWRFAAT